MYYEIHGEGFPLVMIMGLSADVYWWPPEVVDALSQNFKTIIFDNRGAGNTDKPEIDYSISMFAADTVGLMEALNIKKAHILGLSMGGMIAQEIALNYPESVEKLILCCTHCGGTKCIVPSNEVMNFLLNPPEEATEFKSKFIPLIFTENFIKNNPDFLEMYRQRMLITPIPPDSYQRQLQATNFSTFTKLKNISNPTLILHGKEDILVPPKNAEILAKRIPKAKFILLDNAAHLLFQPNPEMVLHLIKDFLTEKIEVEAI